MGTIGRLKFQISISFCRDNKVKNLETRQVSLTNAPKPIKTDPKVAFMIRRSFSRQSLHHHPPSAELTARVSFSFHLLFRFRCLLWRIVFCFHLNFKSLHVRLLLSFCLLISQIIARRKSIFDHNKIMEDFFEASPLFVCYNLINYY